MSVLISSYICLDEEVDLHTQERCSKSGNSTSPTPENRLKSSAVSSTADFAPFGRLRVMQSECRRYPL